MGFFSFKKKDKWQAVFNNCDFTFAANELISNLSGGIIPAELSGLLDAFINNPCLDNAIDLITFDPKFAAFFKDNKSRMARMKLSGVDVNLHPKVHH